MAKVFISYRRSESLQDSARIYDHLATCLPAANVFKDIHVISKGDEFRTVIQKTLSTTDAVLVLMGPRWLSLRMGDGTRRLDHTEDYVHLEVLMALANPECLVIPVLLNQTLLPDAADLPEALRPLAHLDASVLRDGAHFTLDMKSIMTRIQAHCGEEKTAL